MVVTDRLMIETLTMPAAWDNYVLALARLATVKCPSMEARLESTARASLEIWFRWQEVDRRLDPFRERTNGARWDNRRAVSRF